MNHDTDQPSLAPPQIYELHGLTAFKSIDILLTECKKRRQLAAKRWMPVRQLCRDAVLFLLPGSLSRFLVRLLLLACFRVFICSCWKYIFKKLSLL